MGNSKWKCIFFDRDGVVNVPPPEGYYITRPEDFKVYPEFIDAVRIASEYGYDSIVVTNQQGVAKEVYSHETLKEIHEKLIQTVEEHGLKLMDIYVCTHLASENCACRKPKPGMLFDAAKEWNIDLSESLMVGDRTTDIDAGAAAGCKTILINEAPYDKATINIFSINQLPDTIRNIFKRETP